MLTCLFYHCKGIYSLWINEGWKWGQEPASGTIPDDISVLTTAATTSSEEVCGRKPSPGRPVEDKPWMLIIQGSSSIMFFFSAELNVKN